MAKRQNFVVGSTNQVTETLTDTELNRAWDQYDILGAGKLDGVFNSVSDYSNDSSNEIANAIQSITGSEPTGNSQSELANALALMRSEIETTSLSFKGYVATSAPSSSTYSLIEGNLWINSATMPTSFPVAASNIKKWDGSAWVNYGSTYTPADFDFFRNINDNEGYYWFGGQWTVMSTDMDTTYFELNPSGKWTINDNMKNISNWSSNVTNGIIQISQDINLTLSSGTLTLKAGAKVYVPNGSGVFDAVTTSSDINVSAIANRTTMILYRNGSLQRMAVDYCYSGATAPTPGSANAIWYDTTNNVIKYTSDTGSTWTADNISLPLCIATETTTGFTAIKQVFNGIGFIGRTLYVLPGVKALHSNGFNNDGTLKNDIVTVSSVLTYTGVTTNNLAQIILHRNGASCQFASSVTTWKYDSVRNIFYYLNNNDTGWINIGTYYYDSTAQSMTQFNPKLAFHAVDYSDYDAALSTKANDAAVVKLTGNQSIGGTKTFTGVPYFAGGVNSSEGGEIQFAPTNNDSNNNVGFVDVVGTGTNERIRLRLGANEGIMAYNDGKAKCTAPAASSSTSDTWIATTGWVNDYQKSTKVVHREGDEVIGGTKTFSAAAYGQASAVINSLLTTSGLFKQSGSIAGYVKLGNGIIIQWGRSSIDSTLPAQPTNVNIVFPYAFSSNTSYSVTANNYMNVNSSGGYNVGIDSLTSTGFTYRSAQTGNNIDNNVFWVAIGF